VKRFVTMLVVSAAASTYIYTIGIHFGLSLTVRCLLAAIAGGLIGWVMKKLQ
jgi:uncharacterized membrane protein YjjB (DUF3815 family)